MKKIKLISLLLTLLVTGQYANAQSNSDEISYSAYLKNALPLWEKAIELHVKEVTSNSGKEEKLALAKAYYGYLSGTMATQNEEAFNSKVDKATDLLDDMIEEYPKWGEPKALMSSIMGLKIAYSPLKGAVLGMKSGTYMSNALKQSPESPLVMQLYAGSKQYTPAIWGGSKKVALEYYEKTVRKYEENGTPSNHWLYADALANLGIVYTDLDKKQKAKEVFEKALQYEPEFNWVKMGLLPKVADSK